MWFLDHPDVNGLYNVGTGTARSFNELAKAVFDAMDTEPVIEYTDMPKELRGRYQYCTCAGIDKLRNAGYTGSFSDIRQGVYDYVKNYLSKGYEVY